MEALLAILLLLGVFSQEANFDTSTRDDHSVVALETTTSEPQTGRDSMHHQMEIGTVVPPHCTPGHRRVIYRDLSRAGAATVTSESIHSTKCHGVCPDE